MTTMKMMTIRITECLLHKNQNVEIQYLLPHMLQSTYFIAVYYLSS